MKNIKPTDAELEILSILWKHGSLTVRSINETMNEKKKVGYTTTLKILQIMFEKGLVLREIEGRGHSYTAKLKEGETQDLILKRIMNNLFEGSAANLVLQALGNHKASEEEIRKIRELLDKMENEE